MKNKVIASLLPWLLALIACQESPAAQPLPTAVVELGVTPTVVLADAPQPTARPVTLAAEEPPTIPAATAATLEPAAQVTPAASPTSLPARLVEPLNDGQIRYRFPVEGFALTFPANWSVVDYLALAGESTEAANGELAAELVENDLFIDLVNAGLRLYALDTSETARDSANPATILLFKETIGNDLTFEEFLALKLRDLQASSEIKSGPELADYALHSAEGTQSTRINYVVETTSPVGNRLNLAVIQAYVWQNGEIFVVTATWLEEEKAIIEPAVEAILSSLEIESPP